MEAVKTRVTPEQIEEYRRNGAVCIRNAFSPDEIELLRCGIDKNILNPSERAKIASRPEDTGCFFEDFCNWQHFDEYRRFIWDSGVGEIAGLLMGSDIVRLYHDHLLVKEAKTQQRTPWHQDQPYYNIEGFLNCSLWIPVDPVPIESTLEFIAGSHLGPWLMPRTFMDNQSKWFPEGSLDELPNIEADRSAFPIIRWELEPGDMVCFHMLTLHASSGSSTKRRAFSIRFMGDDIRHAPRPWRTSPDFPGLVDELPAGAAMEHPLFPILWQN